MVRMREVSTETSFNDVRDAPGIACGALVGEDPQRREAPVRQVHVPAYEDAAAAPAAHPLSRSSS